MSGSLGLAVAGLPGAVLGICLLAGFRLRHRLQKRPSLLRPVLIVLLVELRSGRSVLGALQTVGRSFPGHAELTLAARVATISGLSQASLLMTGELKGVLSQLARAQQSGAALGDTVRSMIEADMAAEKARRVARARSLPVRLMLPLTLLLLPGLVLLIYAPSMLRLFQDLSGPLT
ncbi:MAG: type II secretion system F family protein [Acidimicrobiia bacterium]